MHQTAHHSGNDPKSPDPEASSYWTCSPHADISHLCLFAWSSGSSDPPQIRRNPCPAGQ